MSNHCYVRTTLRTDNFIFHVSVGCARKDTCLWSAVRVRRSILATVPSHRYHTDVQIPGLCLLLASHLFLICLTLRL